MSTQRPVAEGLFTWPSEHPALLGSRCPDCGETTFPVQRGCPACPSQACEEVELGRSGTLWTWTVQHCVAQPPRTRNARHFLPFGVGSLEREDGVRVESRLTENDPSRLRIGMEMELVIETFFQNDEGEEVVTFAFRPVEA